jgi:putative DNA primase/helicase
MIMENKELNCVEFLKALYSKCEPAYINLRFLPSKVNQFISTNEIDFVSSITENVPGENCYFGVATREDGNGTKEGIKEIPALWVDIDFKDVPEINAREQITNFQPQPTYVINSGGGLHLYWLLKHPADPDSIAKVEDLLDRLANHFKGDPASTDASRILRIPGTNNLKYDPIRRVYVTAKSDTECTLEDFDFLPPVADKVNGENQRKPDGWEQECLGEIKDGEGRNVALAQLAGRYIGKGLSRAETLLTLIGVNSNYNPPLPREDVETILNSVIKGDKKRHPDRKISDEYEAEIMEMFKDGWDDAGMGKIFGNLFSGEYCYIDELKGWYRFNGVNWINDTHETEVRMVEVIDIIHELHYQREKTKPQPDFKKPAQWHHTFRGDYKIRACLSQAENYMYKSVKLFDTDPWSLVCSNGVIDLNTGNFRNARPEDLFLKNTGVVYSPDAVCPIWLRFLNEVFEGNCALIEYLQRAIGYSLTGSVREDKFFLLEGSGSNGKTTLLEILRWLLGSYITEIPFEQLEVSFRKTGLEATPDIAKLAGIRLVKSAETKERSRFNVGRLKSFTGGDTLTARFLHQNPFDFEPTHKLWLSVNHLPRVDDDSYAMWRRVDRIPFRVKFVKAEKAVQGERVADEDLRLKMKEELSGILNWAIQGCIEWQRKKGLYAPKEVNEATEEYRKESDFMGRFFEDEVDIEEGCFETINCMHKTYQRWCAKNEERPLNKSNFGRKLSERGIKSERRGTKKITTILGVQLRDPVKDYEATVDNINIYEDRYEDKSVD